MKRLTTILCSLAFLLSGVMLTAMTTKAEAQAQKDLAIYSVYPLMTANPLSFQPNSVCDVDYSVKHDTVFLSTPDVVVKPELVSATNTKSKKHRTKTWEPPRPESTINSTVVSEIIAPPDSLTIEDPSVVAATPDSSIVHDTEIDGQGYSIVITLKDLVLPIEASTEVKATIVPSHTF